jgi:hypothetical protein
MDWEKLQVICDKRLGSRKSKGLPLADALVQIHTDACAHAIVHILAI